MQKSAVRELEVIADATANLIMIFFVGLPFVQSDGIFNVSAALYKGSVCALIPKVNVGINSNGSGVRVFTPGATDVEVHDVSIGKFSRVPFGTNIQISYSFDESKSRIPGLIISCEVGEDLWSAVSPSNIHCLAGSTLIVNPFSCNEEIGQGDYLRTVIKSQSGRNICGYVSAGAGWYESTQDSVCGGRKFIAENGRILCECNAFDENTIISDIDIDLILQERLRKGFEKLNDINVGTYFGINLERRGLSFTNNMAADFSNLLSNSLGKDSDEDDSLQSDDDDAFNWGSYFGNNSDENDEDDEYESYEDEEDLPLDRVIDSQPFFPFENGNEADKNARCREVAELQAHGLARRLSHIHCKSAVIGLSGGLDSTLALLITAKAFDICKLPRSGITAITMPCFGTSDRTYNNACQLARASGVTLVEVKIADSVRQHFADIGQEESNHDVTYENSQARERTQVLMDYANKVNGIVIGTGDLSELALGWCTYNGDHMSMYGVNASVPKTLVRHIVKWIAETENSPVLKDILDTPVSPELLPPTEGNISQVTEDLVGPYELHDFFLYYVLRYGFEPAKILYLAENSNLAKTYDRETMVKWLKTFYRRFFTQQFKRSCMPDGAKVGSISLSPRGDWKMPSDSCGALWLKEVEKL